MNVLHLSDTPLSGSPLRISRLIQRYCKKYNARCFMGQARHGYRYYGTDIEESCTEDEIRYWIYDWADIIHYHNRWVRQGVFKRIHGKPPEKPSVIQIHSPRGSEDFSQEIASGIPIACLAQYHERQWPEKKFVIPNVIDIHEYVKTPRTTEHSIPVVSYAPSNTNARGWDNKSYGIVAPILKRLNISHKIYYKLINQKPFDVVLKMKGEADIGIDEVSTGSYHLSSLEYLAMGCACICNIDGQTEKTIKNTMGASWLPWCVANKDSFERVLMDLLKNKDWAEIGDRSRKWMEEFYNPERLCQHYINMYEAIL